MIERIEQAARLAADYLANNCSETGRFNYRINTNPDVAIRPAYNMVRHCGTIYAMAETERELPSPKLRKACEHAAAFLLNDGIAPLQNKPECLAVWSSPKLELNEDPVTAKLGASALGLLALLTIEKNKPGSTKPATLQGLAKFLVHMQQPEGGFYTAFIPSLRSPYSTTYSLYYPGETILALATMYEHDKNPIWLMSALRGLLYLTLISKQGQAMTADHWTLIAISKLLEVYEEPEENPQITKGYMLTHAIRIANYILSEIPASPKTNMPIGCFTWDGRTTPTATRLEGFIAIFRHLGDEHNELKKQLSVAINAGINFLLGAQVTKGLHRGGITRLHPEAPEDKHQTEIRIDYVQHALSVYLGYLQTLKNS